MVNIEEKDRVMEQEGRQHMREEEEQVEEEGEKEELCSSPTRDEKPRLGTVSSPRSKLYMMYVLRMS